MVLHNTIKKEKDIKNAGKQMHVKMHLIALISCT